jgi:hypothetical protein
MDKEMALRTMVQDALDLDLSGHLCFAEWQQKLAAYINELIDKRFPELIRILYRVDVDEARLRALIKDFPGQDAGSLIAQLIIDRQFQKIESRKQSGRAPGQSSEETW